MGFWGYEDDLEGPYFVWGAILVEVLYVENIGCWENAHTPGKGFRIIVKKCRYR